MRSGKNKESWINPYKKYSSKNEGEKRLAAGAPCFAVVDWNGFHYLFIGTF